MLDLKETLYEMAALGALKPVDPDAVTFANSFLFDAINIGEEMLVCGAEINVVEKTIHDICRAYGAKRVDVYATAYQITVTIYEASFGCLTQTRRIPETTLNFTKLEEFDRLARRVVDKTPTTIAIEREIGRINALPTPSFTRMLALYGIVSAAWTVFFGGDASDGLVAAVLGIVLRFLEVGLRELEVNKRLSYLALSLTGGFLAVAAVRVGAGHSFDAISIGNIMLFIPGIALTNSIRDMFNGDLISGLFRFVDSLLQAVFIALGFAIALVVCPP